MRIFLNQKLINNINELIDDPSVNEALIHWGKEELLNKSSIELKIFNSPFGSISLLYGPRQIGKTASLKLFLSQVQDSETLIFTDCSTILDKADLARHLSGLIAGKTTIVLDEVQEVPQWHLALRSLYQEGRLRESRVWCTGSEARYLLESGERLPGRKGEGISVFARPWSFREYMDFFFPEAAAPYRSVRLAHVTQDWLDDQGIDWSEAWGQYLLTGGIPRAVAEFHSRRTILDATWRVYIDWILGNWSKLRTAERSLASVARRLCETMNSRVSFEAIKKGTDIQSANTVKTLLEIQEDHFSLRVLPRYDLQNRKFLPSKLKKIYPLDPYVARVWASVGWNVRRLFEESIPSLHLDECAFLSQTFRRTQRKEVSYLYSDATKAEVDFFFEDCGFELKSNGRPSAKQMEILKRCPRYFLLCKTTLPLAAYLVGEGRDSTAS